MRGAQCNNAVRLQGAVKGVGMSTSFERRFQAEYMCVGQYYLKGRWNVQAIGITAIYGNKHGEELLIR